MGCLNVDIRLVRSPLSAVIDPEETVKATFVRKRGDLDCAFSLICATGIRAPYLEIEPTVIWLVPWAMNDVSSNTHWNVG